jgi:hypothetical protein
MFSIEAKNLGRFDVAVIGGGIAGVCAAISSARAGARTLLVERGGSLGGTLTEGFMPNIIDSDNKGGIVRELLDFLNERSMTCTNRGERTDKNGKLIPGRMVDTEGCKYFFDKTALEAGVEVLFYSQAAAVNMNDGRIDDILLVTECGNYSISADVYIDATGNGLLSALSGCSWECGDPIDHRPSPTSISLQAVGMPPEYNGTDSAEQKAEYGDMLREHGITTSIEHVSVKKLPSLLTWDMGTNFQYDVSPDDIRSVSRAVIDGRAEIFRIIADHKRIPGYEKLSTVFTGAHIGIREGRRILGRYRITDDDIINGRRFDDGICLVTSGVDVHKLSSSDTTECARGYHTLPFHIPYRALLPLGVSNMLLAGRCLSGDFYPHAAYRMMGNMAATGEAAGFAAAESVRLGISVCDYDGKAVHDFMHNRGYEL